MEDHRPVVGFALEVAIAFRREGDWKGQACDLVVLDFVAIAFRREGDWKTFAVELAAHR